MRTRGSKAACRVLRGISNPIAVKVGSPWTRRGCRALVTTLNRRISRPATFIHRFGAKEVRPRRPKANRGGPPDRTDGAVGVRSHHRQHRDDHRRIKTRRFETSSRAGPGFRIHGELGSYLGGVHIELTGDDGDRVHRGCARADGPGPAAGLSFDRGSAPEHEQPRARDVDRRAQSEPPR